jgi:hypothetical protein
MGYCISGEALFQGELTPLTFFLAGTRRLVLVV